MRLEWLFARLSRQISLGLHGKDAISFQKLLRYYDEPEQLTDTELPPEAFAAMFGAKKKEPTDGK